MTCHICGGKLEEIVTDLPFKVDDNRIVIIKNVPVLQCRNCSEYVIEDAVMEKIDTILSGVDATIELEVLSYVA
jgi:YgiT-type zinc finger domain-containing protein